MTYRLILTLVVLTTFSLYKCRSQTILPLFKYEGAYIDSIHNRGLVIPSLELRIDDKNKLFHSDSLVFVPEGNYELCIYEIVNRKYLLITAINKTNLESPGIYMIAKQKVKLFKIGQYQKFWELDFNGAKLVDIECNEVTLRNSNGTFSVLKF
ncbi:hypothetical protein [Flavihumibacter petaseus]|uniref:Uncharacterized protein n=1 Tax=Flavihumibacter petaseus NBRC 106054 TaxID=1220578 RepID=A0A0E9MWR5_9BACT|nr:hypothetical protein [Flavihumibacter petaseus]GAO42029.1 hypothetical protein FPE01S_01_10420 [Flavihumibacter petaseus NBRC 106054]